MKHENVDI